MGRQKAKWEIGREQQDLGCSMREDNPGSKGDLSTGSASPHWQWCRPRAPKLGSAGNIRAFHNCSVRGRRAKSGLVRKSRRQGCTQAARLEMVCSQHSSGKKWGRGQREVLGHGQRVQDRVPQKAGHDY